MEGLLKKCITTSKKLIFPMGTYCLCCGNLIDNRRTYYLCDHCIKAFAWDKIRIDLKTQEEKEGIPIYLDKVLGCTKYGIYERRLIFSLKYNKETFVAPVLSRIIFDRLANDDEDWESVIYSDFVVPVPVSEKKLRERGFNQTEKIGKHLSKMLNIPQMSNALFRDKDTKPQRALTKQERFFNLSDVFKVSKNAEKKLKDKEIILLDDVYTTGSTANSCAKALKEAGAKSVKLIVIATSSDYIIKNKILEQGLNI